MAANFLARAQPHEKGSIISAPKRLLLASAENILRKKGLKMSSSQFKSRLPKFTFLKKASKKPPIKTESCKKDKEMANLAEKTLDTTLKSAKESEKR